MTSYRISIGYNSARPDREASWRVLKAIVAGLREDNTAIAHEALLFDAPSCDQEGVSILDYALKYRAGQADQDLTLTVYEGNPGDEDARPAIVQYASGGDPGRTMKEHLRRAFCRLVVAECHRRHIEVNLHVH